MNRRMHPDDATSLFHIVQKLSNEKYDPILLYKPQGEDVVVGPANMHGTPAESLFSWHTDQRAAGDVSKACIKDRMS